MSPKIIIGIVRLSEVNGNSYTMFFTASAESLMASFADWVSTNDSIKSS